MMLLCATMFADSSRLSLGYNPNDSVSEVRFAYQSFFDLDWKLKPKWEGFGSLWQSNEKGNDQVFALGGRILLDYQFSEKWSLDFGSGPVYITRRKIHDELNMGHHLQFDSSIGIRRYVGESHWFGYSFHHYSNMGLDSENPGQNFHLFHFTKVF